MGRVGKPGAWRGATLRPASPAEKKVPAAAVGGGRESKRTVMQRYSTASTGAISPARIATPLAVTPGSTR